MRVLAPHLDFHPVHGGTGPGGREEIGKEHNLATCLGDLQLSAEILYTDGISEMIVQTYQEHANRVSLPVACMPQMEHVSKARWVKSIDIAIAPPSCCAGQFHIHSPVNLLIKFRIHGGGALCHSTH